jgi:O-acetylserine/cysteine efflux transporter
MLSAFRFLLCALPLVFFIKKPDVPIKYLASYGLLFGVGLWGMVSLGIYFGISAGITSLVLQMSVFSTILLGYFLLGDVIDTGKKIGFILAMIGMGLIISLSDGSITYLGLVLVLLGALAMSITNIIIKKAHTTKVFAFIIWSSLFSPIPLFLLAYVTQGEIVFIDFFTNLDKNAIFSILFQVYPTTLVGYWVWNSLLRKYPVSTVAPITLLVPIFGLYGSYLIFDEDISVTKILACIIIILALAVNTFGRKFFVFLKN